jgi:hypothetical protein
MNDQAVRQILQGFLPGATVLFLSKDGQRMVLAVDGPADGLIDTYQRQGFVVEAHAGLRKAS